MRRREFMGLLGGLAAIPLSAYAQRAGEMRRIAVLLALAENDPETQDRVKSFQQGMRELGWIEGRNIRIDYRFAAAGRDRLQTYIFRAGRGSSGSHSCQQHTDNDSAASSDAHNSDCVCSDDRPSCWRCGPESGKTLRHVTGLMDFEFAIVGKWLELLKEVAPKLTQVSVLWTQSITYAGLVRETERTGPRLGLRVASFDVSAPAQFEAAITETARGENGALVLLPTPQNSAIET